MLCVRYAFPLLTRRGQHRTILLLFSGHHPVSSLLAQGKTGIGKPRNLGKRAYYCIIILKKESTKC